MRCVKYDNKTMLIIGLSYFYVIKERISDFNFYESERNCAKRLIYVGKYIGRKKRLIFVDSFDNKQYYQDYDAFICNDMEIQITRARKSDHSFVRKTNVNVNNIKKFYKLSKVNFEQFSPINKDKILNLDIKHCIAPDCNIKELACYTLKSLFALPKKPSNSDSTIILKQNHDSVFTRISKFVRYIFNM
jgi:hypothetical protein